MAVGCLITTGFTNSDTTCNGTFGGLLKIYIGNKSQLSTVGKNALDVITGITMSNSGKAYLYEFEQEVGASFIEALQADAGSFVKQTIALTMQNITQAKKQILGKFKRAKLFAIIQKPDGTFWLAGETGFGLSAKTLEITTGQKAEDIAQCSISLEGSVLDFADEVSASAAASIVLG